MRLSTHAHVDISRPPGEVFDFLTSAGSYPMILQSHGPIPGVAAAEMIDGASPGKGARRSITLSDGVALEEEIVAFERPVKHGYIWRGGLRPPFAWLVGSGHGHWTFSVSNGGTRVDWRYEFELTPPLVHLVAKPVVWLFHRWMRESLARAREALTSQPA